MEENSPAYDHDYGTCTETYATLRIFSDEVGPDEVTAALQIQPTRSFRKGEEHNRGKARRKAHGWFFSTEGESDSRDSRFHLDLILNALAGKEVALRDLQSRGCKMDITHLWFSVGHGGPELWPDQMSKLGTYGLAIWWDVYFDSEAAENSKADLEGSSSGGALN